MGTLVQFRKSLQSTIREMQTPDVELSQEIDDLIDMAVTSWLRELDQKEGATV